MHDMDMDLDPDPPASSSRITVRPALSLVDARALSSLNFRAYANDAMYTAIYDWPAEGSAEKAEYISDLAVSRTGLFSRWILARDIFNFLAIDKASGEPVGFAGWRIKPGSRRRPPLRTIPWMQKLWSRLYRIYDAVIPYICPWWIYGWLYPRELAIHQRRLQLSSRIIGHVESSVSSEHKQQGHWVLMNVGVLPQHRGKGVASQLLEWGKNQADRAGQAIYLSASSAGEALYRRHGFEEIKTVEVVPGEPGRGYRLLIMVRPPQSRG